MNDEQIAKIFDAYGLDITDMYPPEKGYRNESHPVLLSDGRKVNLILYKYENDIIRTIKNANTSSNFLATKNFPVRVTIDNRIVYIKSGSWQKYASVYSYLPGDTIPWEAYSRNHIKILGKTMSDMHSALSELKPTGYLDVSDIYMQITLRMQDYLLNDGVKRALLTKLDIRIRSELLDSIKTTITSTRSLPNKQVLHMDFVRSNVLFATKKEPGELGGFEVSGIIDFEKVAYGHPLYDIARTYAFLLVDCKYKTPDQIKKYFLHSGYDKRGNNHLDRPLLDVSGAEDPLLSKLVELFLVYDLYKFLRHNPYESLKRNEHFIRTCKLLRDRRLIS